MPEKMMEQILSEIKNVLQTGETNWKEVDVPTPEGKGPARGFKGWHNHEWLFLVVEFDIEDQGFPPGSKGYDGTASNFKEGKVVRLTTELAREAFLVAQEG
jgi:hypothetical protein